MKPQCIQVSDLVLPKKKKKCLIWLEYPVNKILNIVPPSATIRQEYDKVEALGLD